MRRIPWILSIAVAFAVACGDDGDGGAPAGADGGTPDGTATDAQAVRSLATVLGAEAERYAREASTASAETCAALAEGHRGEVLRILDGMAAHEAALDETFTRHGRGDEADVACTLAAAREELRRHEAVACTLGDPAADAQEASVHAGRMDALAEHLGARADQLLNGGAATLPPADEDAVGACIVMGDHHAWQPPHGIPGDGVPTWPAQPGADPDVDAFGAAAAELVAEAAAHRQEAFTMSADTQCRSELERHRDDVGRALDVLERTDDRVDALIGSLEPRTADAACTTGAIRQEMERYASAACATGDVAGDRYEALRHAALLHQMARHQLSLAMQLAHMGWVWPGGMPAGDGGSCVVSGSGFEWTPGEWDGGFMPWPDAGPGPMPGPGPGGPGTSGPGAGPGPGMPGPGPGMPGPGGPFVP